MGPTNVIRKQHLRKSPTVPRLRNPNIPQWLGGSLGTRGSDWETKRHQAMARDKFRSTISGSTNAQSKLEVDHIIPFRLGGTNKLINLRTVDNFNQPAAEQAGKEKPAKRFRRY